jgi:hypothetical protein
MSREIRVYKPKGKTDGSALKLQARFKNKLGGNFAEMMLFLEIARQTGIDPNGNSSYDWHAAEGYQGGSVTMKLGVPDVTELLLVLRDKKKEVGPPPKAGMKIGPGLFHQNPNGNTILKFIKAQGTGYWAQLSTSKEHSFKISISEAEAIAMERMLTRFLDLYYNWDEELTKKPS